MSKNPKFRKKIEIQNRLLTNVKLISTFSYKKTIKQLVESRSIDPYHIHTTCRLMKKAHLECIANLYIYILHTEDI